MVSTTAAVPPTANAPALRRHPHGIRTALTWLPPAVVASVLDAATTFFGLRAGARVRIAHGA